MVGVVRLAVVVGKLALQLANMIIHDGQESMQAYCASCEVSFDPRQAPSKGQSTACLWVFAGDVN